MSLAPLRVGIAGLGTVGGEVARMLRMPWAELVDRTGRGIELCAVSARQAGRDRGFDPQGVAWYADAAEMAAAAAIDVVVEAIGGADGPALAVVEAALTAGRSVVTANKALLAHHGNRLAARAEERGVALAFEAAVAGGIPIIKMLREGLAGNRIVRVMGILNGTSNYILSAMAASGRSFDDVLAEAQALGYAEADSRFDIDGIDAAHKLSILAGVAFGAPIDFASVSVQGIRDITASDIAYAHELGYRIKLLGVAEITEYGLDQRVHPCMVPLDDPLAHVDGVFNAIEIEGSAVGKLMLEGRGAGAGPTASAVIADLVDLARGHRVPAFGQGTERLRHLAAAPAGSHRGPFFLRLKVVDRPGVIAEIAEILRDEAISIASVLQRARFPDGNGAVPLVIATHVAAEVAIRRAIERMRALDSVTEPPHLLHIIERG